MERKYIAFHTGKPALILALALIVLPIFMGYATLWLAWPKYLVVGITLLGLGLAVFLSFRIDQTETQGPK